MAFRAGEAAESGTDEARHYLVSRTFSPELRKAASGQFLELVREVGPAIDGYPSWHPLVAQHDKEQPETYPSERCGYKGLDHTRLFLHGFVTCPYGDGQDVIDSAELIVCPPGVTITARRLETSFYSESATSILVRCNWHGSLEQGGLVPKKFAVPLMLEEELPGWRWAQRAESWETMRPYILGSPHGNRSSLFVSQDTALAMKKIYIGLVESGMYGPVKD